MAIGRFLCVCFCFISLWAVLTCTRYEPNWASIDSRPLPAWYDEAKVGIFIHWGVFSVPSFVSEWFWFYWRSKKTPETVAFMKSNFRPDFTYQDFAADFTAEFYDPDQWAEIFAASGARYVVLTSKHHEGFTNWPSKYSYSWNSMDVGPNRDLVGELARSIRTKTPHLKFGLYHSLFEWFNPVYMSDSKSNFTTNEFPRFKAIPELYELVTAYKPEVVWSDGAAGPDDYWNPTKFLAWLYNDSPVKDTVVTNDRWSSITMCKHGGFFTCQDRYNPGKVQNHKWENAMTLDKTSWGFRRTMYLVDVLTAYDLEWVYKTGKLQNHKWENAMTLDKSSWGFRRTMDLAGVLTAKDLITTLVETVSCGGNILINVGPTKDGRIVPIFEERLRTLGQWLQVNGDAIYGTVPWKHQNDTSTPHVWYTYKAKQEKMVYAIASIGPSRSTLTLVSPQPLANKTLVQLLGYPGGQIPWRYTFKAKQEKIVYAIVLDWPSSSTLTLMSPQPLANKTSVQLLGYPGGPIPWRYAGPGDKGITLTLPVIPFNKMPCDYAWVFSFSYLT